MGGGKKRTWSIIHPQFPSLPSCWPKRVKLFFWLANCVICHSPIFSYLSHIVSRLLFVCLSNHWACFTPTAKVMWDRFYVLQLAMLHRGRWILDGRLGKAFNWKSGRFCTTILSWRNFLRKKCVLLCHQIFSPKEVSTLPCLASETPWGRAVPGLWQEFALACIQIFSGFPLRSPESCCLVRGQTRCITCVQFFCCTWPITLISCSKNQKFSLSFSHLMCYRMQVRDRKGTSETVLYVSFISELSELQGMRKKIAWGTAEQCLSAFQKTKQQ